MLMTILTFAVVALTVLCLLLMSDVRELMASVSDTRFRVRRLERRLLVRKGIFDSSPETRKGGLV